MEGDIISDRISDKARGGVPAMGLESERRVTEASCCLPFPVSDEVF